MYEAGRDKSDPSGRPVDQKPPALVMTCPAVCAVNSTLLSGRERQAPPQTCVLDAHRSGRSHPHMDSTVCNHSQAQELENITQDDDVPVWEQYDLETSTFLNTVWEDLPSGFKDGLRVRTIAVVSACCKTDVKIENRAWDTMRRDVFNWEISDPVACRIGM